MIYIYNNTILLEIMEYIAGVYITKNDELPFKLIK
jgi:hypothetical protein